MLFEFERKLERDVIAVDLRTVADSLENGDPRTLEAGGESVPTSPPGQLTV